MKNIRVTSWVFFLALLIPTIVKPSTRIIARLATTSLAQPFTARSLPGILRTKHSLQCFPKITPDNDNAAKTAFLKAVDNGDIATVALLLTKSQINPNATLPMKKFALHQAAARGDIALLELLLDRGANINIINEQGKTALMCAAEAQRTEAVKFLLAHGADSRASITCGNPFTGKKNCTSCRCRTRGWTAVDYALTSDNVEILLAAIDPFNDLE